jgi:hypothetical protein
MRTESPLGISDGTLLIPAAMDEDFWDELLTLIEEGRVIPVVGERAVVCAPGGFPLYPWLAQRLAKKLNLDAAKLPENATLSQVVTAWFLQGGERNKIYTGLHRILRDESPAPGSTLCELASINAFTLFITTTFDRLLERAINQIRFSGAERTDSASFWPEASEKDVPVRKKDLSRPMVFHLLGRVATVPEFVVWEEDVLEYICALHQYLPVMERLARDLKEYGLLIFGLNFSDWLVRFFLRIAKQSRLSEPRAVVEYLAEGPRNLVPESMVLFFGVSKTVHIVDSEPAPFAAELARRWRERHPETVASNAKFVPAPPAVMPKGAIFLSYAREDEAAVIKLKYQLEKAGCEVWYDQERLKAGMFWADSLEDEVLKRCSLFISVISRVTENAIEAYYHRERAWAANRAEGFSPGEVFYIPVIVDDCPFKFVREPRLAPHIQAVRAADGLLPPDFAARLRDIQMRRTPAPSTKK